MFQTGDFLDVPPHVIKTPLRLIEIPGGESRGQHGLLPEVSFLDLDDRDVVPVPQLPDQSEKDPALVFERPGIGQMEGDPARAARGDSKMLYMVAEAGMRI
jgi:hypothetical protein